MEIIPRFSKDDGTVNYLGNQREAGVEKKGFIHTWRWMHLRFVPQSFFIQVALATERTDKALCSGLLPCPPPLPTPA